MSEQVSSLGHQISLLYQQDLGWELHCAMSSLVHKGGGSLYTEVPCLGEVPWCSMGTVADLGVSPACAHHGPKFSQFRDFFWKFGKIICWHNPSTPPEGFVAPPVENPGSTRANILVLLWTENRYLNDVVFYYLSQPGFILQDNIHFSRGYFLKSLVGWWKHGEVFSYNDIISLLWFMWLDQSNK